MTNLQAVLGLRLTEALTAPFPPLTRRHVRLARARGKATAVVGVRGGGKTSLLRKYLADRLAEGRPRDSLLLLGLDDERLSGITAGDLAWFVDEYYRRFPARGAAAKLTLCLDDVQVVPGWEKVVRRLLDTEKVEVLVSGSSAGLLTGEGATSLRGRATEILLHPFSFREALRHARSEPAAKWGQLRDAERSALDTALAAHLSIGGFPEVQGLDARDRLSVLQSYVDTAVLRDVIDRHAVSNAVALRWLQRELLANPGGAFSISKLCQVLTSQRVAVAKDTLHEYLGFLEDAFLVRTVALHTSSERKRMVNPRKAYPVDPGLIPLFQRTPAPQAALALETVVMLELERRGYHVAYVRTSDGFEVDFHASAPGRDALLVQICADGADPKALEQKLSALKGACRTHSRARALLLTMNATVPAAVLPKRVEWQPAARWLTEA